MATFRFLDHMAAAARDDTEFGFERILPFFTAQSSNPQFLKKLADFVAICTSWAVYFEHPQKLAYEEMSRVADAIAEQADQESDFPGPAPMEDLVTERNLIGLFLRNAGVPPTTSSELDDMEDEFYDFTMRFELFGLRQLRAQAVPAPRFAPAGCSFFQIAMDCDFQMLEFDN